MSNRKYESGYEKFKKIMLSVSKLLVKTPAARPYQVVFALRAASSVSLP